MARKEKIRSIAIMGASGYVATHLIQKLITKEDVKLYLVTNRPENLPKNIENSTNISIIEGNLGQKKVQDIIVKKKVGLVVNLYAQTDVYFAEDNILEDYEINVASVVRFFSFLVDKSHSCRFIQFGTVTQCGLTPLEAIDEEFDDKPITTFDFHKLVAENYVKKIDGFKGFETLCFRLPNVYGGLSRQFSGNRGILNRVIQAAKENQEVTVYGDGEYLRNYIHVYDVAECILKFLHLNNFPNGEVIFLANDKSHTLLEVWSLIAQITSKKYRLDVSLTTKEWPQNAHLIEKRNFVTYNRKLKKYIGNIDFLDISEGLEEMI